MSVIFLTRNLLEIPSPSGEERAIGTFLSKRLEKNFKVTKQSVGDRFNILATRGEPRLLLTTHIDTVPDQLSVKEDENFLYGRGACDTKGIIAAMICAAEEAVMQGINDFGLLFDVSEETDFAGVQKAIDLVTPKVVIVGEPTNMSVAVGQKGLIGVKIRCIGKSAPGATPELGVSAIDRLISALTALQQLQLPKDELLGETTMNVGLISGGSAVNVVAESAEALVEFRTIKNNSGILQMIKDRLIDATCEVQYSYEPAFAGDIGFLSDLELQKIVVPFFTEMYFWARKANTIVFGPGDYRYAHSKEERVSKDDLEKSVRVYLRFIQNVTRSFV